MILVSITFSFGNSIIILKTHMQTHTRTHTYKVSAIKKTFLIIFSSLYDKLIILKDTSILLLFRVESFTIKTNIRYYLLLYLTGLKFYNRKYQYVTK